MYNHVYIYIFISTYDRICAERQRENGFSAMSVKQGYKSNLSLFLDNFFAAPNNV